MTETALDAGYESHAAFTRAFRAVFGFPPATFAARGLRLFELPNPTGVHFDLEGRPPVVRPLRGDTCMQVEIRDVPAARAAAIPQSGPYWQIGATFEKVAQWARASDTPMRQCLAIFYDYTETTPPDQLRSDACLTVPDSYAFSDPAVREVTLQAGRYAVTTHVGPYSGLGAVWGAFYGQWLPQSGHTPADRPSFELYLNSPMEVAAEQRRTELYVPVEA